MATVNQHITLTGGAQSTLLFTLIRADNNVPVNLNDVSLLQWVLKKHPESSSVLIEKDFDFRVYKDPSIINTIELLPPLEDGKISIALNEVDTQILTRGEYYHELRFRANGKTVVALTGLSLIKDVVANFDIVPVVDITLTPNPKTIILSIPALIYNYEVVHASIPSISSTALAPTISAIISPPSLTINTVLPSVTSNSILNISPPVLTINSDTPSPIYNLINVFAPPSLIISSILPSINLNVIQTLQPAPIVLLARTRQPSVIVDGLVVHDPVEISLITVAPTITSIKNIDTTPVALNATINTPTIVNEIAAPAVNIGLILPPVSVNVRQSVDPNVVPLTINTAAPSTNLIFDVAPPPLSISSTIISPDTDVALNITPGPVLIIPVLPAPEVSIPGDIAPTPVVVGIFALVPTIEIATVGWTELTPHNDTQFVYVSSSTGNNANPGTEAQPVQTLAHARTLLRNGQPDWMLLKKGDVWTESFGNFNNWGGRGPDTERLVFTTYGSGARPLIQSGLDSGISFTNNANYIVIEGLHFFSHTHENFPEESTGPGINLLAAGTDLLIENCYVEKYEDGMTLQERNDVGFYNLHVRRCIIVDSFGKAGAGTGTGFHSQGIYMFGLINPIVEECVIDHNGWHPDFPLSYPTFQNHNMYIQGGVENLIVRRIISTRASAKGCSFNPTGLIIDSLFVKDAESIFMRTAPATATRNVVLQGIDVLTQPQFMPLAAGIGVSEEGTNPGGDATLNDNIVAHQESLSGNPRFCIQDWRTSPEPLWDIIDNNTICYDWRGEPASHPPYVAPERTVAGYHGTIGGTATLEAFLTEARLQSKDLWREEYTSIAVNAYIREGFQVVEAFNSIKQQPLPEEQMGAPLLALAPRFDLIYDPQIDADQNGVLSVSERATFEAAVAAYNSPTGWCCIDQEAPFNPIIGQASPPAFQVVAAMNYYIDLIQIARGVRPDLKFAIWGQPMRRALVDANWRSNHFAEVQRLIDVSDGLMISAYDSNPISNTEISNAVVQAIQDANGKPVLAFMMPHYEISPFYGNAAAQQSVAQFETQIDTVLNATYNNERIHKICYWANFKTDDGMGNVNPIINFNPGDTTLNLAHTRYLTALLNKLV